MDSVLFYLPVMTPWWFDRIVAPLIRAAARDARVSVLVPPLWRNTGIAPEQLAAMADLPQVDWYILDGDDHPDLRQSDGDNRHVVALVRDIAPDLVLCRSADIHTPARFPGVVRHIMEGAAPPFATDPGWVQLAPTLFDHGMMPPLNDAQRARLGAAFAPVRDAAQARFADVDRAAFLATTGLPAGKRIVGLALEFEHPEMFFGDHQLYAGNAALIDTIAERLGDDCILACTNHPLNELQCDNAALHARIAAHGGRVRLLPQLGALGNVTMLLARHADGLVTQNSKSFAGSVFFGTPMARLSGFRTGDWMRHYDALDPFFADLRAGTARTAAPDDALAWFAYHFLDAVFDPTDRRLTAAALFKRATLPLDEARWGDALDRIIDARIAGTRIAGRDRRAARKELAHV